MVASLGYYTTSHNHVIEGYELETARRGTYLCNYNQLKYGTHLHANLLVQKIELVRSRAI